jgi:hypothetical protein
MNLQHSYGYSFDQKMWDAVANLFSSNGTMELGLRGVYAGRSRIRRALETLGRDRLDEVHDHLQLDTVVHIAPDGRTAKARGVELSVSGAKGRGAQWEEGIFENEYVRQGGVWRIQSVHYYPRVITDYERGWAKDAKPAPVPSTEFPPDRPPTEAYGIYPKMYYPRFHYTNPVTGLPVQYPPGVTATVDRTSPAATMRLPRNAKEFTETLNEVEGQIHSSIAFDAVENLVGAHGYYLDDFREDELQALFSTAPERGSRRSAEAGTSPAIHQMVQPVIQVANDGKSATIRARVLKVGGKAGEIAGGAYEGRAILRGGVWKLQSLALRPAWSSPFSQWAPVVEGK